MVGVAAVKMQIWRYIYKYFTLIASTAAKCNVWCGAWYWLSHQLHKCITELTRALEKYTIWCFYADGWFVAAQLQYWGKQRRRLCVSHIINIMYYSMGCVLGKNLVFSCQQAIPVWHVVNFLTGWLLHPHRMLIFGVALTGSPLRLPTVIVGNKVNMIFFSSATDITGGVQVIRCRAVRRPSFVRPPFIARQLFFKSKGPSTFIRFSDVWFECAQQFCPKNMWNYNSDVGL